MRFKHGMNLATFGQAGTCETGENYSYVTAAGYQAVGKAFRQCKFHSCLVTRSEIYVICLTLNLKINYMTFIDTNHNAQKLIDRSELMCYKHLHLRVSLSRKHFLSHT